VTLGAGGSPARAVPSFARQTSLPCAQCHTEFPALTPFGREFKLNGYTLSSNQSHLPPLAVMAQGAPGFTHTSKGQKDADFPSRFDSNDNVSVNQVSLFYAGRLFGPYGETLFGDSIGKIVDKVGVFVQGTWDGVEDQWAWDNMEVRASQKTTLAGKDVVVGTYVNNNPTLQDLWNTTPAWGFPFSTSGLAPAPAAAPLIAGGLSQEVMGFGGYAMYDDLLYLEAGGYGSLSADTQSDLGIDPSGQPEIDGMAPTWRVALQKSWGAHYAELGTYGMYAPTYPGHDGSMGHDRITDTAADLEYQWLADVHALTLLVNWIYENQDLNASRALGLARNKSNYLWTASITGSYLYDRTYGLDLQYFDSDGDADPLLYSSRTGRPDSSGWIFQINYLPFNKGGGPWFWPYSKVKLSLQYTLYQRFDGSSHNVDGTGRDAMDNDTLYLEAWIAF